MDGLFLTSRRHWWERVNNTVIEFHLSVTSGLSRARTWTAHLTDIDANDCGRGDHDLGFFLRNDES